jgi:hypothetical protein
MILVMMEKQHQRHGLVSIDMIPPLGLSAPNSITTDQLSTLLQSSHKLKLEYWTRHDF